VGARPEPEWAEVAADTLEVGLLQLLSYAAAIRAAWAGQHQQGSVGRGGGPAVLQQQGNVGEGGGPVALQQQQQHRVRALPLGMLPRPQELAACLPALAAARCLPPRR
jgi:L-aminopeptidase/D-esterase-like protein